MDKYLVVGSPGRYKVVSVAKDQEDYKSGMSKQAADETAVSLNNKYYNDRKGTYSPTGNLTTSGTSGSYSPTGNLTTSNTSNTSSSSNESERETLKPPTNVIDSIGALYKTQGGITFWNSLKDKPQSTVIAQLLRDINNEKIQITPEIKRELFNADIIEENLDEAREEGLSKYLNKYGSIYKPIEFVKDTEDKKLTSTVKPQDVVDYSIFGNDEAVYIASAAKVLKSKNMSEALELLKKYNTFKSFTFKEQEKNTVTIKESREALNDLLTSGDIGKGEYFGFSKALDIIEEIPEGANNTQSPGDALDLSSLTSSQEIVTPQVIVLGPNGARTTANSELSAIDKARGETRTELERLLAGDIPGREGYKDADKIDYVDTYGGHSTGESVSGDYKGDYGGEDASTPDSEKESLQGAGNTGYDNKDYSLVETETTQNNTFVPNSIDPIDLNNVPVGAEVWDVEGTLYLAYAVPGAGDLYTGSTIWMAYDVVGNDLFKAGLLTEGFEYKGPNGSPSKSWFDTTAILSGNSNQLIGMDSDPFASFVETYKEEALLRPWLLDNQFIELQAEAALEDRDISESEWRATTWYQTNNQAKRDWMDIELSDPSEAQRQRDDLEIYYKNQLQGLGVSNVPDGLIQWVSSQNITGSWSDLKTAEQLQLFADPYKTGERDDDMLNLISTSGFGDVDRTSAREKEVVELYRKWLGPSLGSLTQDEVSSIAGRLRDDPDYEDALVNSLKQSRLAAFGNYTNPELTYEDIARPWRNLTTSVWGQNADEKQGWWQEMLKSNDYSTAQTTLREKGLEQNINQVSVDASQALQNALGQGSVSQSGVNV